MRPYQSVTSLFDEGKTDTVGVKQITGGNESLRGILPYIQAFKREKIFKDPMNNESKAEKVPSEYKLARFITQVIPNSKDILRK
jgi:hypothetical protein